MEEDHQKNQQQEENEVLDIDISELREAAIKKAKGGHKWRQKGIEVYCKSCEFQHGFFVKPGTILIGIDKRGMPILEDKDKKLKK